MSVAARVSVLALALVLVVRVTPAWSGAPTDQLRGSIDRVLHLLNDPVLKAPGNAVERETALRRVIEARFDVDEIARQTLGPSWRERTPEERRQFTGLFRELLERSYIVRIERYQGERVKYVGESVDGDYATVRTAIVTTRGTEIPVDYRLFRRGDQWLVYDVLIERVSLVDNYRSQFRDIILTSSYHELARRIEAKLDELRAARRPAAPRS